MKLKTDDRLARREGPVISVICLEFILPLQGNFVALLLRTQGGARGRSCPGLYSFALSGQRRFALPNAADGELFACMCCAAQMELRPPECNVIARPSFAVRTELVSRCISTKSASTPAIHCPLCAQATRLVSICRPHYAGIQVQQRQSKSSCESEKSKS